MSKLDAILRDEIRRVAQREFKALVEPLLASNKRLREEVRALRSALVDRKAASTRGARTKVQEALASTADQSSRRWSGARLRAWRDKHGLSGVTIAAMLGASSQTLYNWENGRTRPDEQALAAIAGIRAQSRAARFILK